VAVSENLAGSGGRHCGGGCPDGDIEEIPEEGLMADDIRLTLEWEETSNYSAEGTLGEIRELLGLGGTPDDMVAQRVHALAEFGNGTALLPLQNVAEYEGTTKAVLHTIGTRKVAG
jgi:hypothetical protein